MRQLVMTYNIHSGRDLYGKLDISLAAAVIRAASPDIVALNEVRRFTRDIDGADQAAQLRDALGMHMAFGRAIPYLGGEYGIALLSKWPILAATVTPVPDVPEAERMPDFEARAVLACDLDVRGTPLRVFVIHVGLSGAERTRAIDTLCALLDASPRPCLVLGDFNMTPDDPALAPLLACVADTAGSSGLPLTFPADQPREKIDYIFSSPSLQSGDTWTVQTTASDHLPLLATVEVPEA